MQCWRSSVCLLSCSFFVSCLPPRPLLMTLFLACLNICYASNLPLLLWILTHALAYTMLSEPLLVDFFEFWVFRRGGVERESMVPTYCSKRTCGFDVMSRFKEEVLELFLWNLLPKIEWLTIIDVEIPLSFLSHAFFSLASYNFKELRLYCIPLKGQIICRK